MSWYDPCNGGCGQPKRDCECKEDSQVEPADFKCMYKELVEGLEKILDDEEYSAHSMKEDIRKLLGKDFEDNFDFDGEDWVEVLPMINLPKEFGEYKIINRWGIESRMVIKNDDKESILWEWQRTRYQKWIKI